MSQEAEGTDVVASAEVTPGAGYLIAMESLRVNRIRAYHEIINAFVPSVGQRLRDAGARFDMDVETSRNVMLCAVCDAVRAEATLDVMRANAVCKEAQDVGREREAQCATRAAHPEAETAGGAAPAPGPGAAPAADRPGGRGTEGDREAAGAPAGA